MRKCLFLVLICAGLSVTASATTYEAIASMPVDHCRHVLFPGDGTYCYQLGRDGEFNIYDVSDLFELTAFTEKTPIKIVTISQNSAYAAVLNGDYLYTAKGDGIVIDVSDPLNPVEGTTFAIDLVATNFILYDHPITGKRYLLSANWTYTGPPTAGSVEVFDVSDPANPVSVALQEVEGQGWSLEVYNDGTDNFLFLAAGWDFPTLHVFDFNDPENLAAPTTSITLPDLPYELRIADSNLVCSNTSDIYLWDITDPYNPVQTYATILYGGRACAQDDINMITMGEVHKVDLANKELVKLQDWYTHGTYNGDGFPWGSDVKYVAKGGMVAIPGSWDGILLRTVDVVETLTADTTSLSAATGGQVNLTLDASIDNAGRNYLMLGSSRGTTPGILLPGGQVTLPLNWDHFTTFVFNFINTPIFVDFMSVLDSQGGASAQVDSLGPFPATSIGTVLDFAYTLYYPFDFASNNVSVELVP